MFFRREASPPPPALASQGGGRARGSFAARLIAQTRADVAPVYFEGQNSRLFQIASHIHLTLRLSLLFKETHDRIGSTVRLYPGSAIPHAALVPLGGGKALMDHLRALTYDLAARAGHQDRHGHPETS